jgi:Zn-finger nucleic acid-binding protein
MTLDQPACPICGGALQRSADGALDTWACAQGHGLAMTITEAHGRLDEGEIAALWAAAKTAAPGGRACPICARVMATVSIPVDPNQPVAAPAGVTVAIDACTECELLWFDAGELAEFPMAGPIPGPSPEEQANIDKLTAAFGRSVIEDGEGQDSGTITEHLYRHLAKHPLVVAFADRMFPMSATPVPH